MDYFIYIGTKPGFSNRISKIEFDELSKEEKKLYILEENDEPIQDEDDDDIQFVVEDMGSDINLSSEDDDFEGFEGGDGGGGGAGGDYEPDPTSVEDTFSTDTNNDNGSGSDD